MTLRRIAWVLVLALITVACSKGPNLQEPPPLRLGRDVCAECGMTIDHQPFAAGYYDPTGEVRLFDDFGDLVLYMRKHGETPALVWVHDFDTGEWIPAAEATYVVAGASIGAPHHQIAAFRQAAAAEAFASGGNGLMLNWAELLAADTFADDGHAEHEHGD